MGKKPLVGLFGLVWAGIALTGCGECCRNNRNKYNATPTFPAKTASPDQGPTGTPSSTGSDPRSTDKVPAPPPKPQDGPSGLMQTGGTSTTSGAGGTGTTPAPVPGGAVAPNRQESLRRRDDKVGFATTTSMPTRGSDGSLGNQDMGRPADGARMSVPPPPITGRPGGVSNADNLGRPAGAAPAPAPAPVSPGEPPPPGGSALPPINAGSDSLPPTPPGATMDNPPPAPTPGMK
jgi:hypothetical protein